MLEMSGNASETKCVSAQRGKCIDIKLSTDRASLPVVLKTRNVHDDGRNKPKKNTISSSELRRYERTKVFWISTRLAHPNYEGTIYTFVYLIIK